MSGSFFGVQPYVSSGDANPINAPWNERTRECRHCLGTGIMYSDFALLNEEEYNALADDDKIFFDKITCPHCNGNGIIAY